jgi:hypothetical protein
VGREDCGVDEARGKDRNVSVDEEEVSGGASAGG